jgi:hypothetical protein
LEVVAVRVASGQVWLQIRERGSRGVAYPRAAGFKSFARKPRNEERASKDGPLWVAWPSGAAATKEQLVNLSASIGKIWAAQTDVGKGLSTVGVYDRQNRVFTPVKDLPGIWILTEEVWADEAAKQIYFVHDGDLLRAPF